MPDVVQTCRITGRQFTVNEWEQEFLQKMDIPLPTLCIEERLRRRLAHRNERTIYPDQCDLTGKAIISMFSPDKTYKVYSQAAWWSDDWDPRNYGRDFDFSRPFFEQFAELQNDVPHLSLMNVRGENSEYCNITSSNRNCYLVFGGDYNEDCYYSVFNFYCKNSMDLYWVNKSELTYDCIDCYGGYNLRYSQNAYACRDSSFLFECRNLSNCFGCVGLRNKQYHIFNKAYSKEEYERKIKEFRLDSFSAVEKLKKDFEDFKLQFPRRFAHIVNSENVTGDNITNAQNCVNCFAVEGPAQDMKDIYLGGFDAKDMLSCDHVGFKAQLYYEMLGSIEGYNCAFCSFSWTSQNTFYCDMVMNSKDLFACSNMKRAQYCILNKQYSEAEYHDLKARIIEHMKKTGEWGEFFPIKYSLYGYNETVAHDIAPISKETAMKHAFKWHDDDEKSPREKIVIPDSINDVSDEILTQTLTCESSSKPYKVIPQELALYRSMGVPIPRITSELRNKRRINMRNPAYCWQRKCDKCGKDISTSYSPDKPYKVYCESCYLAEVY